MTLETTKKTFSNFTVLNGTNKDNFSDYRTGLKVAEENKVRSSAVELDISKKDVRELAKYFGISYWHRPASRSLSVSVQF
jgi:uncharacterized protein